MIIYVKLISATCTSMQNKADLLSIHSPWIVYHEKNDNGISPDCWATIP